jgi:hypothetical protein
MADKIISLQVSVDTKTGQVNVDKLGKGLGEVVDKTEKAGKKSKEATAGMSVGFADAGSSISMVNPALGGMIGKLGGLSSSLTKVIGGFKTMRFAIIATGLGLLVITIAALAAAFTGSEKGQNQFAKLMGMIGVVTGNLRDLLADLGEKLIKLFKDPQKALSDFSNLLKTNIINRFDGLLELLPAIGKAISLVFDGKFDEAGKVAANAVAKVGLGVENVSDKIAGLVKGTKEYIAEQQREVKLAMDVADKRAKAAKIERKLLVDRAAFEANISELKLKAREIDKFTAQERSKFLKEATLIEDKLLIREQEALRLKYEAQVTENSFSRTNIENADKEAQAKADLSNIETRRNTNKKATLRELNRVNKELDGEEKERVKAREEAEKESIVKRFELEKLSFEERRKIVNEDSKLSAKDKKDFLAQLKSEEEKAVEAHNKSIADLNKKYDDEKENRLADTAAKKEKLDYDRKVLEINSIAQNELEKQTLIEKLDAEHKVRMLEAQKTDGQKKLDEAKLKAAEEIAIEQAVANAKLALQNQAIDAASQGVSFLKGIFEKNKALQKAALIAESAIGIAKIVISTQAANAAAILKYALIPGGAGLAAGEISLNKISASIGIAGNIAATAKGLSALGGGGGASASGSITSGAGGGGGAGNTASSNFTPILPQSVRRTRKQDSVRVYLVESDVTDAQKRVGDIKAKAVVQ